MSQPSTEDVASEAAAQIEAGDELAARVNEVCESMIKRAVEINQQNPQIALPTAQLIVVTKELATLMAHFEQMQRGH